MSDMFLDVNPEKDRPRGSYFGITVTDGYNWHQCYSWAWECANYWDVDKFGRSRSVYQAFPSIDWKEDETGVMHQIIAINEKLTPRPAKRFFEKKVVVDRRTNK